MAIFGIDREKYARYHKGIMFKRLISIPLNEKNSFFLFGPRGTGKTSWVKHVLPHALYLDLLKFDLFLPLQANPDYLEKLIPPDFDDWIILDEVQKIPEVLNVVHRLIENNGLKFVLTGSSSRSLRKKGVNLLAGRAHTYFMHPLIAEEMGTSFDLTKALRNGLLPSVWSKSSPEKYLESYISTYLQEEILAEGLTRNLGAFSRFLEASSFSNGQMLNISAVAKEANTNRKSVEGYFSILEDLLLAYRLPVFSKRAQRSLTTHPKFYFFDTGVYHTIRPRGPLDAPEEVEGSSLETLFLQHVLAINDYLQLGYEIYFWRTVDQLEVDFVLYGPRGILAFEIKRGRTIGRNDLKGLNAFGTDYPQAKLYLLSGVPQKEYHGKVQVLPYEQTLLTLSDLV